MRNTHASHALRAGLCLLAVPACVMPQHRAIATVVNTALLGAGVTGEIVVAADNANPDSWHLFNKQAAGVAGALIIFALVGELITLGAHEDPDAAPTPAPAPRTPSTGHAFLMREPLR